MSTLNVSNITDGTTTVGTSYVVNGSAKAWVNFDGTGTIAARDSFNVSSLTDNSTGNYYVNYSTSFANTSYACPASSHAIGVAWLYSPVSYPNTASRSQYQTDGGSATDSSQCHQASFGDLA